MVKNNFKYMKLSPQDDIKNDEYFRALQYGIDDPEISNIALTGPYGSGKSSILKTFKKNIDNYNYLNISLASFNESEKNNKNISNLIQESILKQIFYQVDIDLIPFSRFKRINNKGRVSFLKDIFLFITWCISFFIIFFPNLIAPLTDAFVMSNLIGNDTFRFGLGVYFVCTSFYLIYKLYFLLYTKIKFMRIKVLNTEFEVNTSDDSSILSKNSDELLYLFESTDYDVVIFEDLDRFENIDVFTKLRELNEMINNADNINTNINFIYALRDDLFNEFSDRLKFFDFIIPVVPIVNSTNSANQINSIIDKYNIQLDSVFVNEISSYIDDMRLIKNIFNEYNIYKNTLDSDLNKKSLFSVITYKNMYPVDFSSSLKGKGLIYESFDKKRKMIFNSIQSIQKKIDQKTDKLEAAEYELLNSIEELRRLCGNLILSKNNGNRINLNRSTNKNTEYTINNFIKDEGFNKFLNSDQIYSYTRIGSSVGGTSRINTSEVLKSINYNKRKEIIKIKSKLIKEELKEEISQLKREKVYIKDCSFSEYYNNYAFSSIFDNSKYDNKDLLKFILINGYIKESTYENYISYLDSSNMTVKDIRFVMKTLSGQSIEFDYELTKIDKIVERLNSDTFTKNNILNYDLLEYLIKNKHSYFESIIKQLGNGNKNSFSFIEGFINTSEEKVIKVFINQLAKNWEGYWAYIMDKSNYSVKEKNRYLIWIIKYVDIQDIVNLNKNKLLKKYIEKQSDIIDIAVENDITYKIKEVIKELKIKFNNITVNLLRNNDDSREDLFYYIYENNFYKINIPMIFNIIRNANKNKEIDDNIYKKNYTTILENNLHDLNKYLKKNINDYIENVFLKLENNKYEAEEALIKLLNNKHLNIENKKKILTVSKNKITFLVKVTCIEIYDYLFKKDIIKANWMNLLVYYKDLNKELNQIIVEFINRNYSELSILNSEDEKLTNILSTNDIKLFIIKLLRNNKLKYNVVQEIAKNISFEYNDFEFEKLDENIIEILITEKVFPLSPANYNKIKLSDHLNDFHILLLEHNEEEILKDISEYKFINDDVIKVLKSNNISKNIKNKFINKINFNILLETGDKNKLLEILNEFISEFNFDDITRLLKTIGNPYSDLIQKRGRPVFANNDFNKKLFNALERKDYISSFTINEEKINVYNRYK